MSREEAKEFLAKISYELGTTGIEYFSCKDGEKMREAIQILDQQSNAQNTLEQSGETRKQQMMEGFTQFMQGFWNNPNLQNPMRDATVEEQMSVDRYIESISHDTGVDFFNFDVPMVKADDCISRQEAIDATMKDVSDIRTHDFNAGATRAANRIEKLPPVTPARMRGHWEIYKESGIIKCSRCGRLICTESPDCYYFCPKCGSDNREVSE